MVHNVRKCRREWKATEGAITDSILNGHAGYAAWDVTLPRWIHYYPLL